MKIDLLRMKLSLAKDVVLFIAICSPVLFNASVTGSTEPGIICFKKILK